FKATLEELAVANVLVHVVDASHPQLDEQVSAVESLLGELELADRPTVVALNKVDRVESEAPLRMLVERFDGVAISARTGEGLDRLRQRIGAVLRPRSVCLALRIPYRDGPALALCYERGRVLARADGPEGIRVDVELPARLAGRVEG